MKPDQSKTNSAREGRRYRCFYQGYWARRTDRGGNPYPTGSEDHACWQNGWSFADRED